MKPGVVILFLFISFQVHSQFNVDDYLIDESNEFELETIDKQLEMVESSRFSSPLIREVQFRMRLPDFESSPNDYRLRFSPTNPWEKKANKVYKSHLQDQLQSQRNVNFATILARRYQLVVERYFLELQLIRADSSIESLDTQMNLISNEQGNSQQLIRLLKRKYKLTLQKERCESDIVNNNIAINRSSEFESGNWTADFKLIPVNEIENLLNDSLNMGTNILVTNEQNKARLTAQEWNIRKTESFSDLGYIQPEFNPNRDNKLGMQIGIEIPIVNPDKPDLERRKLEVLEDQQKVKEKQLKIAEISQLLKASIQSDIKQYRLILEYLSEVSQLKSLEYTDVAPLLEIHEFEQVLLDDSSDHYERILVQYIKWLHINGVLSQKPLRNYLKSGLPFIE